MRQLCEYIVSISAAALFCGILGSMMPKGTAKEIIRLVAGLFLAFTVIRPITDLKLSDFSGIGDSVREEASEAAAIGEEMTREAIAQRIKEELESYILDKAGSLRLELTVEVTLGQSDYLPESVRLTGEASPYLKQQMILFLTDNLKIPEEDIQWTL